MGYHEAKDPVIGKARKHQLAATKYRTEKISNAEVKPTPAGNVIENLKRIVKS